MLYKNKHMMHATEQKQAGFSLIELMVGMAVGLIVSLVIAQIFGFFDSQRRVTSGTANAQTNGAIAIHTMSREMQMAGYGLMASLGQSSPLECSTVALGDTITAGANAITGLTAADAANNLAPVTITAGAAGASDTITIRYGTSMLGGMPTVVTGTPGGGAFELRSNLQCRDGDIVLATQGNNCALTRLAADDANPRGVEGDVTINLDAGENAPAVLTGTDFIDFTNISCLGDWVVSTYRVNNGILQRTNNGNTEDLISGVASIQAQYGISLTQESNEIVQWVEPTGAVWGAAALRTTAANAAGILQLNRNRIKAVRLAVIARNDKEEPVAVSQACDGAGQGVCSWDGAGPNVDLSTADANWANYRYRVFDTIIPLRNMIWSRETL